MKRFYCCYEVYKYFCICSQTLLAFQKEEFLSPGHQMPYSKQMFPVHECRLLATPGTFYRDLAFPSFDVISRRAKALIDDIVSRGHESPNGQPGSMHEMIIPAGKAGLIIGRGGETIKQLQVWLMEVLRDAAGLNCSLEGWG